MTQQPIIIDASFQLRGATLPLDHGYALFAALSRAIPTIHDAQDWSVHPVQGEPAGPGELRLTSQSRVRLRLPIDQLQLAMPLTGQTLEVDGHQVRVSAPEVTMLQPHASLRARYVTIKGFSEPQPFGDALDRQLLAMFDEPVRYELGERRVMRIRDSTIVGFAVAFHDLPDARSLLLQARGLGGRRKMGAGVFYPTPEPR